MTADRQVIQQLIGHCFGLIGHAFPHLGPCKTEVEEIERVVCLLNQSVTVCESLKEGKVPPIGELAGVANLERLSRSHLDPLKSNPAPCKDSEEGHQVFERLLPVVLKSLNPSLVIVAVGRELPNNTN